MRGISLAVFTAVLLAVLPGSAAAEETGPRSDAGKAAAVVARVGEQPIYRAELEAALRRGGHDRIRSPEQRLRLEAETIEQLVDERLLRQRIAHEKIDVDKGQVTTLLEQMRSQFADRNIVFETFLAQSGRDEASLRSQIELDLALNKLIAPRLTTAAIASIFAESPREFDGTRLRVSHIVLRPDLAHGTDALPEMMRKADAIRREILTGTITFAEAAKKYSAGPSRRRGGDLGYVPRHGAIEEKFSQVAFKLAKGEISKPFVTPFGVHLVTVTDVEPGTVTVEAVRPQLEKLVAQQAIREIVASGREDTRVTFAAGVPRFDPATPVGEDGPRRIVLSDTKPAEPAAEE
jgi:peptidyl-prolyl cis-trans isomerase C